MGGLSPEELEMLREWDRRVEASESAAEAVEECMQRLGVDLDRETLLLTISELRRRHPFGNAIKAPGLPQRVRLAVAKDFGNRCVFCRRESGSNIYGPIENNDIFNSPPWMIMRMTPYSRGGSSDTANLVPACRSCGSRKGAKTAAEFLETL